MPKVSCSDLPCNDVVRTLREARVDQTLKLTCLAQRTGYDKNTVMNWEQGKFPPSIVSITDWANALGYDLVLVKRETKTQRQVHEDRVIEILTDGME